MDFTQNFLKIPDHTLLNDYYLGIARDHPESYHTFMWNNFFKHVDVEPQNVHILDGNAVDLQEECDQYEDKIKMAGGIHLFMGGKSIIIYVQH